MGGCGADGLGLGAVGGAELLGLGAGLEGAVGGRECDTKHTRIKANTRSRRTVAEDKPSVRVKRAQSQDKHKDRDADRASKLHRASACDSSDLRGRRSGGRRSGSLTHGTLKDYDDRVGIQKQSFDNAVQRWLEKAWTNAGTDVDTGRMNVDGGLEHGFSDDFDTPVISTVPSDCEADDESDQESVVDQKTHELLVAKREEALLEVNHDNTGDAKLSNHGACAIM